MASAAYSEVVVCTDGSETMNATLQAATHLATGLSVPIGVVLAETSNNSFAQLVREAAAEQARSIGANLDTMPATEHLQ